MQNPAPYPALPGSARRPSRSRVIITLGCAAVLLAVVGVMFWYQDYRYSLPTPRPAALADVNLGTAVALPANVPAAPANDQRPLWLHFFNPDCPCTRFNAEHVRTLRTRFGAQVRFVAVAQTDTTQDAAQRAATVDSAAKLYGPGLEIVVDDGTIATSCGVYSTPQAVILTHGPAPTLLFRGNYNASRYCADPQTEFVRLALTAVANHEPLPPESRAAMIAYGCQLPANVAAARSKL